MVTGAHSKAGVSLTAQSMLEQGKLAFGSKVEPFFSKGASNPREIDSPEMRGA